MGINVLLRSKNPEPPMSALGHKRTWRLQFAMSALSPKADIPQRRLDVCFVPKVDIEKTSKSACGKRPAGLSLSCRLAKCRHSIRSFDVDVPDEIANYFYRRGIRKFNANELVFDHYHQLELIEPVNAKIVTKMRFICDLIRVNTEILGNKPT
jgi:hypothetical protein